MTSSPAASPRDRNGFSEGSPSTLRRATTRRRSSDSDSSSDHSEKAGSPSKTNNGDGRPGVEDNETNEGEATSGAEGKRSRSPTLQKLTRGIATIVESTRSAADDKIKNEAVSQGGDEGQAGPIRPRKLSVAALIRSFSPRSRAKAKAAAEAFDPTDNKDQVDAATTKVDIKTESKRKSTPRITFGSLKRASLSFPASPPQQPTSEQRRASHDVSSTGSDPPAVIAAAAGTGASRDGPSKSSKTSTSPTAVAKWKQAVNSIAKDTPRLKIQIPPPPPSPSQQPPLVSSPAFSSSAVVDESYATGPGSLVDDVRSTLAKLIEQLDDVDPRKLRSIRLGGELRGLLGKAADEVEAYAAAFRDHARASVGVAIALQNLAASLRQVFPIVEKLRTAKFMLNRQFKRDVTFAFQEINSYYTSVFMELSMAVATRAGLVLPMPTQVAPPVPEAEEEEEDDDEVDKREKKETPPTPAEPTGDELCLTAHCHFFGHGRSVDLKRALMLYQEAAAMHCAVAMRCLGHMYLLGKGVEKDLFVAEQWLTRAASTAAHDGDYVDADAWYLLGCLLCEKAPHQKSDQLTREFFARAQAQFTLAAERGLADAQFRLAELLERGSGSEPPLIDYSDRIHAALPWYRRAAEQCHTKAEAALGRILLLQYDDHVEFADSSLSSTRANHATEAIHWLQRAAASGEDSEALLLLGVVFSYGRRGAKRDVDRGVGFLRRAVKAGSYEAMVHLAKLLLAPPTDTATAVATQDRGEAHDESLRLLLTAAQGGELEEADFQVGELLYYSSLLRDRTAALRFYVRAAQSSRAPHALAARRAATMYYSGVGCRQADKMQAHRLYKVAADAGDAEALNALGLMYEDGEGCDLDFLKAAACYRRAVELGNAHAHFNLGCLLAHGKGVPRNLDAAQAHFSKAVSLGYTLARDFLRPEA